jgi:hypothetical protein
LARLVSEIHLFEIARGLELGNYLSLGRGNLPKCRYSGRVRVRAENISATTVAHAGMFAVEAQLGEVCSA